MGLLLVGGAGVAVAQDLKPATKISQDLAELAVPSSAAATFVVPGSFTRAPMIVSGDWVTINAVAAGDPAALEADLIALGATDTAIAGRMVSGRIPIVAIPLLEGVTSLQFARAAHRVTNAGLVTSQGDKVLRADVARTQFGLDGTGVKVGVLSDSFNCRGGAGIDSANGDLPQTVTVLQDTCSSGTDEGRAMLQIVHDVAPGAQLFFATADFGQAGFANNIRALRNAGANIIVDDVIYLDELMFQDGVVADAVADVVASGVSYFSAAGNFARKAYEHTFVPGQFLAPGTFGPDFLGGVPHMFGTTTMQRVSGSGGSVFQMVLQWDSPGASTGGPGTQNDLDIYILVQTGPSSFLVAAAATTDNVQAGDPVEILGIRCPNPTCVGFIMIVNRTGNAPNRLKYLFLTSGPPTTLSPALNAGTIYGHANSEGAIAVGAANYRTPTTIEPYSSAGTTPVVFDFDGNPIADTRQQKPEIVAPDGADTTFFGGGDPDNTGFPNFFGTSAAAPHAAAVAALLKQALPNLTPAQMRSVLETTATNMGAVGFDTTTGFGLIHADSALIALHTLTITSGPTAVPTQAIPNQMVNLSVDATDSFNHTLTFGWTSTCTGLPAGSFDNATSMTPVWTAPANVTGATQTCTLKVTVSDGHGTSKTASISETVLSVPKVATFTPAAAPVGATVTIGGMGLTGSTVVTFFGGTTAAPLGLSTGNTTRVTAAVTATSLQVVVPAGALTGPVSVTNPAGTGTSTMAFKVLPKITDVTPLSAVGGSATVITVSGFNLKAGVATPGVKIGTFVVPPASIASSVLQLTFPVPLGAVTGKIMVTTADGSATSAATLTVVQPPRATSFAPAAAVVGTLITVTGTNMTDPTLVTFTGGATAVPTPVTATSLKVVVPEGALTGPVSVTNAIGTAPSAASFKVLPKITDVTPLSAVGGSATVITVSGFNLKVGVKTPGAKIGAFVVPSASITSSAMQLTFPVPLGAVTGKIMVTTADGSATSAATLTVVQPPRATSFAPAAAMVDTLITVTGTNMTGATLVTFTGGATAVPTAPAPTATSLKVVVPEGALTGPVSVTNPTGTAPSAASFKVLPKITDVTPLSAVGGSATVITVSGFNLKAGVTTPGVMIGAFVVPPASITSSVLQHTFPVPLGAVTGKITVTTADGSATSVATMTVVQPPRATSFAPAAAVVDTLITVTGTNMTGATLVTFTGGATAVPTVPAPTATSLKVVVPEGALTGPVSVTNPTGTAPSAASFKVLPKITDVTPLSTVGGSATVITVSGFNLKVGVTTPGVKIGAFGVPPASITSSATQLTFPVPLGAVTGKITVTTADGSATSVATLTVVQPPRATSFAPAAAVVGTLITVTGTNMTDPTLVTFTGGATAVPTPVTATSLKVVVPEGALTGPVSVTNAIGTAPSAASFKVLPKITGFAPSTVTAGSATLVTVDGFNLKVGSTTPTVKVGTLVIPPASIVSSLTQVSFPVPVGALSGKITITTADGTATSATPLTVTP
jgi:hypothetical protein